MNEDGQTGQDLLLEYLRPSIDSKDQSIEHEHRPSLDYEMKLYDVQDTEVL